MVHLLDQFEKLVKSEQQLVRKDLDIRSQIVNASERMQKFGIYNTLIPLATQLNVSLKDVNNMKYSEVFTILLYNKEVEEIQKEMNDIKIDK